MVPEEAIKIAIHCLAVQAEQEVCEECDIYGNCHTDCKDVAVVAIKALEEIQQYRKIGTVEECREAVEKQKPKKPEVTDRDFDYYKCPVCGEYIWATDNLNDHKYCLNCGQVINWEESE